jgi:hypothetical protein
MPPADPRDSLPNQELGRNRPMYREPEAGGRAAGRVFLGLLVAAVVALGALWYATSETSTIASNPSPAATGQGSPRPMAPVPDAVTPAPVPTPAPQATPMPTPDPAPPINSAPNQ